MPANLPAEARAKWLRVMEAKTPAERLRALEEFLSSVPRHKGTEKLVRQVRRQMALLRERIEAEKRKRGRRGRGFFLEKGGDAQIVVLGLANSGKSSLLRRLTNARVVVSDVPFETKEPVPGMLKYEGVELQLVEAPALVEGASKGIAWGLQVLALARNADGVILVIDSSADPRRQLAILLRELEGAGIRVVRSKALVSIERRSSGGIVVVGELEGCTVKDVEELLKSYRIHHALVKIEGKARLDDVEEAIFVRPVRKPALVILNKIDLLTDRGALEEVERFLESVGVPYLAVSALTGEGLDVRRVGETLFEMLGLIRIYTRRPRSKEVSERPLVMKKGATVLDVARAIHSRLYKNFRYARVWSSRLKFSPQKVGGDFVLEDGDIVEIVA